MSDTQPQIHKVQSTPSRIKSQNNTIPRHIILKLKKILDEKKKKTKREESKGKEELTYRKTKIRIILNFSETMRVITVKRNILSIDRKTTKLIFYILREGPSKVKEKYFLQQKLKDFFFTSTLALRAMLKILQRKRK